MKTNFKRIGKQSISIVLAVMMMLSTMLVGMVTSNAATVSSDGTGILYFKMNAVSWWDTSGANGGNFAYFYGSTGNAWSEKAVKYQDNIYYVNIPKGDWTQVILTRNSTTSAPNFTAADKGGNLWNQTGNIELQSDKNYITSFSESSTNATFSTVTPTPDSYSLSADKTIVGTNETVTLTPSFDSKLVSLKSNSYNVKKDGSTASSSDYSISGDSITFNNAGTYTISDTITYNANGYSSITGNVTTNDVTITVNQGTVVTYTIKTETPENGTINVSADSLAAGETFKVTATPNEGYTVGDIIVKSEDGTVISPVNGSYTMPANNVTVSATFKVKTDAKYSVTYTDPTGIEGVESASIDPTETTLAAGTAVTVTVTVNDGYTASLAVDGATVTTSKSGNTYTFTFPMPAKAITVAPNVTKAGENTGTEIKDLYLIYSDSSNDPSKYTEHTKLYVDSSNQVFAYFTSGDNLNTSKQYYFLISTTYGIDSYKKAYNNPAPNNNRAFNNEKYNDVVTATSQAFNIDNTTYYAGTFTVKEGYRDTISSVKINLGYYKNGKIQESAEDASYAYSYEVIPTNSGAVEGMPQVFAKDGTIRATYQKYADMADTVLTAENTADLTKYNNKNKYYETAYAKVGTKLKITTTILPEYRDKYFVKAFSINGYSYGIIDASQAKKQNGVYTCEYTIPEDFEGSRIEITPIYYYIDDTDTVTFYVEGFDEKVQKMWGNTVAVQAWYANCEKEDDLKNSKFDSLTKNALGGYPGQPLVYEGGKYSMQIPKYLNGNKANTVSGITLNNYFWDDIHKQNFSDKSNKSKFNCQTYDYDDFYKLSDSQDVDNIIFDFRYRTTTDKDVEGNIPRGDLNSSTYSTDELEPLKDYSGNIVNIFGNILSKDWTKDYDSKCLTVISNGYKNNENIGKYATEWSVYDHAGNRIAQINCSSLIDPSKVDSAYQDAYDTLKAYANLPVKIAYEKSLYGGTDKGTRADGRWYFSKKAQKISANVKIEYKADGTSPFVEDAFVEGSNVGVNTKAQAYFTNADSNGKTTCQGIVDGGNFSVHAQTDADAKYYFIGWYLKTSDGYSFITNESDAAFPMTNNETYVARFIPTPSGTLTLSHTLLAGSAQGMTYISAKIVNKTTGKEIASIAETSGNLVVPSRYVTYPSSYNINVTLRTVPYGNDTVEGFYEGYSADTPTRYDASFEGSGEKIYNKISRDIESLFKLDTDAEGNVSYSLIKSNIPFYSNITSQPLDYKITYTYKTRLNGTQSYVVKDTVSGIELQEMWDANEAASLPKEQLSKAFITKKAPFVSNYREEIKWNIDAAIIDGYTATVAAVTSTDKLKISALTVGGTWTEPATLEYGTLAMSNGDYLYKTGTTDFPSTRKYLDTTDYEFSFWAIFDNREKAAQYSKAVAAYMSGTPDQDMSKRLTALTKLDGYDNLISKSYSKEYNYISYQDYYIVPVYAGRFAKSKINEAQASIRLLEYTRNQWTDDTYGVNGNGIKNEGGSKTDYLYTDFALSFDKDQELIKNNAYIKVGVAFEVVAKYNEIDLKSYVTNSNTSDIGKLVTGTSNNGKAGTYTINDETRTVYKYQIDNSNISVKNRIEYYLRFKNSETSQQNVMKVYSYIYDTVSGEIYLSDPVYMNMYDIGNLTYITSDLANINLGPDATV